MRANARENRVKRKSVPLSLVLAGSRAAPKFIAAVAAAREAISREERERRPALDIIAQALCSSMFFAHPAGRRSTSWTHGRRRKSTRRLNSRNWSTISGISGRRRRDSDGVARKRECRPTHDRALASKVWSFPTSSFFEPTIAFVSAVRIKKRWLRFPANCAIRIRSPRPTTRRFTGRKSGVCFMWP